MAVLGPAWDRYEPVEVLKEGRYGCVLRVLERATGKTKIARWFAQPRGATEYDLLHGLELTSRTWRTLDHAGLPRFDRVVESPDGTWLLFDYLAGHTLWAYAGAEASVSDGWIAWWLEHLLSVLHYLHTQPQPMVVGYIEPADVVVQGDCLGLCDVGLFEAMFPEVAATHLVDHPNLNFIAPERRQSPRALPAADLYSVGAIAYWLCTTRAPVVTKPDSPAVLLGNLVSSRPSLPLPVAELIADLLAYYPSQRPATAAAAQERLGGTTSMRGHAAPAPPRKMLKARLTAMHREPEPERSSRVPAPAADEPERVPALPPWRERWEDLAWLVRRRPVAVTLLAGVGVAALWCVRPVAPPAAARPALKVLSVVSGQVVYPVGPSSGTQGQWQPTSQVDEHMVVLAWNDAAHLRFSQSDLKLWAGSQLVCNDVVDGVLSVRLAQGQMQVVARAQDCVAVQFLATDVLTVLGGTDVTVDLTGQGRSHTRMVHCATGRARLQLGSQVQDLPGGSSVELSADGLHLVGSHVEPQP